MPQIFPPAMNIFSKVTLYGSFFAAAFFMWVCLILVRSSYGTGTGEVRMQPVPFSHEHHVGVLGIDCRYCHTSVETSTFAGLPPTKTCMNCHSQIWVGSNMLEPVRASYSENRSLRWQRVYNLPGFTYFDHSIHVHKGIGCSSCHGQIDQMPLTFQVPSLLMEWCIECHRNPERAVRPREQVFNMRYKARADQIELGRKLVHEYGIKDAKTLTSCTVCHR